MITRRTPLLLALAVTSCGVLGVAVLPGSVRAQSSEERRQAGQSFQAGEAAFEENDNEAALELFRRAFELAPNDVVRFNIAVCLERLGRFREAAQEYDGAMASDALSPEDRERAAEAAGRARQRLGALTVLGPEDGAEVSIDGEALCQVPCEQALDPGEHRVAVAGIEAEQTVEVQRGGTSELRFERAPPTPEVTPEPQATEAPAASGTHWTGPGALTITGAIVAVVGGAGILSFGLLAEDEHNAYLANPTVQTRDQGLLFRDLSNASIGVAALGGVLVLIDLVFLATAQVPDDE